MPKIIENIREKLLAEAKRQVIENGYSSLSIRSVARECGIGIGTVYNYFNSKTSLIAGFLIEDWEESIKRIKEKTNESSELEKVFKSIYTELNKFNKRYLILFESVNDEIRSPMKKYHIMLREQLCGIVSPLFDDEFIKQFCIESLLTWTVEGKDFNDIFRVISKIISAISAEKY